MDREPLLSISEDETAALSDVERAAGHFPQPLRGPSLDNLEDLGINTRELEDSDQTAFGCISFRDEHSLNTNHRLDYFKEHDTQMESAQETEYTYQKVIASTSSTTDPSLHYAEDGGISTYSSNINEDEAPSDQSLNSGMSSWTNMPMKPNTGIASLLSEGKKYHVFFSYEIADHDWVEEVTRKLESPELGFKCSIHERDFHAGKRIIENITEHIRISEKTVLVLSPDFIQSHWCMFEVELGMVLSMEESQLLVVPVMVRQCAVPDSIKTLTYIDATPGNDDWWQKFMDAITAQDTLLTTFTGAKILTVQPRYENMDSLAKLSSTYKCSSGTEMWSPYIPEALRKPGIQVPQEDFDKALEILQTSHYCCCRWFCDSTVCCVTGFIFLLLFLFIAMLILLLLVYVAPSIESKGPLAAAICVSMILPSLAMAIGFFVQRSVRISKVQKAVERINEVLLKSNVITGVTVERSLILLFKVTITMWFYNISECQARTTELIYRHSGDYTTAYIAGKLRPNNGTRHVRNASCLCQFIEEKYADEKGISDLQVK